jgi:hypothetical protein
VSATAGVFRRRVFAETFAPEDVVLHARDVHDVHAGFEEILGGLLRLAKNFEGALLILAGFAENERSADLGVVAIDLRTTMSPC